MEKNVAADFDPNAPGINNGCYFGLPFTPEEAQLVLLPVPWEVTASYGGGTASAPDAILDASMQVDLYDIHYPGGWERGIGTLEMDDTLQPRSARLRQEALRVMSHLEGGGSPESELMQRRLRRINEASAELNDYVYGEAKRWLDAGKKVGVVGGDHSVPLGLIRAVAGRYPGVGILHVDAHADLREAYEGFTYSHASIMYNALHEAPGVGALVQVGIRDFCDEELEVARADERVVQFTDYELAAAQFEGETWRTVCDRIVAALPRQVYVSFDIDGLSPDNCPHTGTPVPGGLSFREAVYLLAAVVESGREIVGFDLCEVGPSRDGERDANVRARVLYKLCNLTLKSC